MLLRQKESDSTELLLALFGPPADNQILSSCAHREKKKKFSYCKTIRPFWLSPVQVEPLW